MGHPATGVLGCTPLAAPAATRRTLMDARYTSGPAGDARHPRSTHIRAHRPRDDPSAEAARLPQRLLAAGVGATAEDEQQVGEAVEVAHHLGVGVLHLDRAALGAP